MYTNYNSQNANKEIYKDPNIYVTEGQANKNKLFSLLWKILLVIIILLVVFLGLVKFGVITLKSDIVPEAVLINQNEIGIKKGGNYQFVYSVVPENSTNKQVVWTSSDPSVVRVNSVTGYAEGLKNGTATITVKTLINEKVSECNVTVSNKTVLLSSININEKYISLSPNRSTTLSYRTVPANATELGLQFFSSDSSVASVNTKGVVTGHKAGSAIITVSSSNGTIKDTAYVTVYKTGTSTIVNGESIKTENYPKSISLNEKKINLASGTTSQLIANVSPSSASNRVTWSSSNSNVATVNANGLVTARGNGTATIVAKTINNISVTCEVTVGNFTNKLQGIDITTNYSVVPVGITKRLVVVFKPADAANKSVTWSSNNPSVASIDQSGNVRALAPGSAVITARSVDGGYTDTATIEVVNAGNVIEEKSISFALSTYPIGVGSTVTLSPIITPSNASFKAVDFVSSDTKIATVDANGVVRGIAPGTATIVATTRRNGLKATATINVSYISASSVKLNTTSVSINLNDTYTLIATVSPENASDKTVTFASQDTRVATVDNNGIIRAVGKGTTTITVTPKGGGAASTCIVTVN